MPCLLHLSRLSRLLRLLRRVCRVWTAWMGAVKAPLRLVLDAGPDNDVTRSPGVCMFRACVWLSRSGQSASVAAWRTPRFLGSICGRSGRFTGSPLGMGRWIVRRCAMRRWLVPELMHGHDERRRGRGTRRSALELEFGPKDRRRYRERGGRGQSGPWNRARARGLVGLVCVSTKL